MGAFERNGIPRRAVLPDRQALLSDPGPPSRAGRGPAWQDMYGVLNIEHDVQAG